MSENMQKVMEQAQALQKKMEDIQKRLEGTEVTGHAGGGLVSITMNGKMDVKDIKINKAVFPEAMDSNNDFKVLEDLLLVAFNDTKQKVESHIQDQMQNITGGLNL